MNNTYKRGTVFEPEYIPDKRKWKRQHTHTCSSSKIQVCFFGGNCANQRNEMKNKWREFCGPTAVVFLVVCVASGDLLFWSALQNEPTRPQLLLQKPRSSNCSLFHLFPYFSQFFFSHYIHSSTSRSKPHVTKQRNKVLLPGGTDTKLSVCRARNNGAKVC